jgi:hypothetical protein
MDSTTASLVRKLKRVKRRPDPAELKEQLEDLLRSKTPRGQALMLSIEKQRELLTPLEDEARQLEKQMDALRTKILEKGYVIGELRNRIGEMEWELTSLGRKLCEDLVDEDEEED